MHYDGKTQDSGMTNTKRAKTVNRWNALEELKELNVVKLEDALLCANCELIVSETFNGRCPVCASSALLGISRLLGGTLDRPAAASFAKVQSIDSRVEARAS